MIKKSDNITSILALIIGLAALTVAIVSLVNNKKDDFTTISEGSCCVDECDDNTDSGWCIYEDTKKSLVFKCLGKPKFTIPLDGHTGIVPALGIIAYHGSTVPDGWVICDGNNTTPDLTDRFILGTTSSSATWLSKMPASGGSWWMTENQMPTHQHEQNDMPLRIEIPIGKDGGDKSYSVASYDYKASGTVTGNAGGTSPYIQPYYKLMYIMQNPKIEYNKI